MLNEILHFSFKQHVYTQSKTHIIAEMLKAAGEEGPLGVELARQLIEAVFSYSVIT